MNPEIRPMLAAAPTEPEVQLVRSGHPWYFLAQFCSLAFLQGAVFVAWNPVANSLLQIFAPDWTGGTFAWQINVATICSPLVQWPIWRSQRRWGVGFTLIWGGALPLLLATHLQLWPLMWSVSNVCYKWISYVSFFLVGTVGVTFFSSVSQFACIWFAEGYITTATGAAFTFANLGAILPALLGPFMVDDPNQDAVAGITSPPDQLKWQFFCYLVVYAVVATVLFTWFCCSFPTEPPSSSSSSAHHPEDGQQVGLRLLLRKWKVWLIMVVYSVNSLAHVWGATLLTVTLSPLGLSQTWLGWMTMAAIVCSSFFTMATSRLADVHFSRDLPHLLVQVSCLHSLLIVAFCTLVIWLLQPHNLPTSGSLKGVLFVLYVLAMATLNSCTPLLQELGCRMAQPVSRQIVSGCFNQMVNGFSMAFYLLFAAAANEEGGPRYDLIQYLLMALPSISFCILAVLALISPSDEGQSADL